MHGVNPFFRYRFVLYKSAQVDEQTSISPDAHGHPKVFEGPGNFSFIPILRQARASSNNVRGPARDFTVALSHIVSGHQAPDTKNLTALYPAG